MGALVLGTLMGRPGGPGAPAAHASLALCPAAGCLACLKVRVHPFPGLNVKETGELITMAMPHLVPPFPTC